MGAREMNPDATLTVVFTGAWNDPVKERAASEALAEQGIDVIGQHVDTPTPQIVAKEKGMYATGHHRDLSEFSSATQCSSVWVWDRFLIPEIKKIAASEAWDVVRWVTGREDNEGPRQMYSKVAKNVLDMFQMDI